jgi:hypothetical protein
LGDSLLRPSRGDLRQRGSPSTGFPSNWYCTATSQYCDAISIYFQYLACITGAWPADRERRHVAAHQATGVGRRRRRRKQKSDVHVFAWPPQLVKAHPERVANSIQQERTPTSLDWRDFFYRSENSIRAISAPTQVRGGGPSEGNRHPSEHWPFPGRIWPRAGSRHRRGS